MPSSPTPKPTPEQRHQLDMIKKEFGGDSHKTYKISRATGVMRVRLRSPAGWWHWSYNRQGELVHSHLDMTMEFEGIDDNSTRSGSLFDVT